MSLSSISDKISQKLKENIQDETRRQFITDLLDLETRYISEYNSSKSVDITKTVKKDFQYLMDQYYPIGDSK